MVEVGREMSMKARSKKQCVGDNKQSQSRRRQEQRKRKKMSTVGWTSEKERKRKRWREQSTCAGEPSTWVE